MIRTVRGSFDSAIDAAHVARKLRVAGFPEPDVNIILNNTLRAPVSAPQFSADKAATEGAIAGGALGGVTGLAVSLLGLSIPGVGPIFAAGPLVAALAGAGAGAVAGGFIASLADLDVHELDAQHSTNVVRRGAAQVTVRVDGVRANEARAILRHDGAFDIDDRVEQWRGIGWEGYDPAAGPLNYAEFETERSQSRPARRGADWDLRR